MKLTSTRTRLEMLTRELLRSWDETKAAWRDTKAREFEERYLVELADRVDKATAVIDKLDGLLNQVRDDCE